MQEAMLKFRFDNSVSVKSFISARHVVSTCLAGKLKKAGVSHMTLLLLWTAQPALMLSILLKAWHQLANNLVLTMSQQLLYFQKNTRQKSQNGIVCCSDFPMSHECSVTLAVYLCKAFG